MRILNLVRTLRLGGIQRSAQAFSTMLNRRGHDAAVWAVSGGGPRAKMLLDAGVETWIGRGRAEGATMESAIKWRPDLILLHSHGGVEREFMSVVDGLRNVTGRYIPVVEHNSFAWTPPASKLDRVDLTLVLGEWCLFDWEARSAYIQMPKPAAVLPKPIRPGDFFAHDGDRAAFRRRHGIPPDAFVLGRVGQPATEKWSPVLIETFERYAADCDQSWMVLVGPSPEVVKRLDRSAGDVRRRVVVVPRLETDADLRAAYNAMDVFVHAARVGESFGNVLSEALMCEVPVVTVAVPHISNVHVEVVGHLRGGLVVHDHRNLVAALRHLRANRTLRANLGRNGRESILSRFSIDAVTDCAEELCELARAIAPRGRDRLVEALKGEGHITSEVDIDRIVELHERSFDVRPRRSTGMLRLRLPAHRAAGRVPRLFHALNSRNAWRRAYVGITRTPQL
jgi:glycosyltransferase involved in cell wall biosynthesis